MVPLPHRLQHIQHRHHLPLRLQKQPLAYIGIQAAELLQQMREMGLQLWAERKDGLWQGIVLGAVDWPLEALMHLRQAVLGAPVERRNQQQVPGRDADPTPHPPIRDGPQNADQVEIACGADPVRRGEEAIQTTSHSVYGPVSGFVADFASALPRDASALPCAPG